MRQLPLGCGDHCWLKEAVNWGGVTYLPNKKMWVTAVWRDFLTLSARPGGEVAVTDLHKRFVSRHITKKMAVEMKREKRTRDFGGAK